MEMTSVATAAVLAPIPPALTTAPRSAGQTRMPSGPRDLEPADLSTAPQAALAPTIHPPSQPPRRIGAAGARPATSVGSAEAEAMTAVIPSATTPQGNSFVQAVHDDIADDEASQKKR
jgi:hypothetical protein